MVCDSSKSDRIFAIRYCHEILNPVIDLSAACDAISN